MAISRISGTDSTGLSESDVQELITGIIGEVLRLDAVAPDDDFFALGGHSLTASQVGSRIRKALDVDVPLAVFFERPTAIGLAGYVLAAAQPGPSA